MPDIENQASPPPVPDGMTSTTIPGREKDTPNGDIEVVQSQDGSIQGGSETKKESNEAISSLSSEDSDENRQDSLAATEEVTKTEPTQLSFQAAIKQNTQLILEAFEQKLKYDGFKEEQIERLHRELQGYKRDLLARASAPVINGVIRLHDNLGKTVESLRELDEGEWTADRLFEVLDGLADDLEILLEENGVLLFIQPEEKFDPRRQTCRRNVGTGNVDLVGTIAARLQPGFERNGQVIRNEKVAVYTKLKSESQTD